MEQHGNIKVLIRLDLSAMTWEDWQLYCKLDSDAIVRDLNRRIEEALNNSTTRTEAWNRATKVLDRYADWGAADTEGYAVLECLISMRFPRIN
jgi:hypothetical protein